MRYFLLDVFCLAGVVAIASTPLIVAYRLGVQLSDLFPILLYYF